MPVDEGRNSLESTIKMKALTVVGRVKKSLWVVARNLIYSVRLGRETEKEKREHH